MTVLRETLQVEISLVLSEKLFNLLHVTRVLVFAESIGLVSDFLGLSEQLLKGALGQVDPVLHVLVELFLTFAVGAGVLGISWVVPDELLNLFKC